MVEVAHLMPKRQLDYMRNHIRRFSTVQDVLLEPPIL
jgi:hypothetical protein